MKINQISFMGIGGIYLFLWALSGMFSPGNIYLDTYISPNGTMRTAKIYNGQKSSSRGIVNNLTREELNTIVPSIVNDSMIIKPGRQILCLSNYTTGSILLDFVPFLPFNEQYKIVSNEYFDKEIGVENYSEYFNLFHMSEYTLAWIGALILISLMVIMMTLTEYFEKKKNEKAFKITSITGKIAGLIVFSKFYFNDDLYISIKVFLNNSFLHIVVIVILSMLITQLKKIKEPLDKFKME
jgi:hypothetical protein